MEGDILTKYQDHWIEASRIEEESSGASLMRIYHSAIALIIR